MRRILQAIPSFHHLSIIMDPIRIEKFQAMKRYKKRQQFLPGFIQYFTIVFFLGIFLSCPLWLPHVSSFLKLLIFELVPAMLGPKFLFVLCNIIVIFLVGESKFSRSSPAADIYDEYMSRKVKNEGQIEDQAVRGSEMEKDFVKEEEELQEEEEFEIDKKAEHFIARVNWQRRLEERRLLSHG